MKKNVLKAGKIKIGTGVFLFPLLKRQKKFKPSVTHWFSFRPFVQRMGINRNEEPFTTILYGGEPRYFQSKTCSTNVQRKLPFDVRHLCLEACETKLGDHF